MKFKLSESQVIYKLLLVIGLLFLGNCFVLYLKFFLDGMNSGLIRLLIKFFDFNTEANLPTCFSSLLLIMNALILALIGYQYEKSNKKFWYWFGLSIVFSFLSLDEMIQIHEHFRAPVESILNTTGIFYFAWFIPYLLMMILIVFAYFKFLMRLPKKTLKLFISSGITYLFGAVFLEAISGMYAENHGEQNIVYAMIYTFEELFEMLGLALFLYALLLYMTSNYRSLEIEFIKSKK